MKDKLKAELIAAAEEMHRAASAAVDARTQGDVRGAVEAWARLGKCMDSLSPEATAYVHADEQIALAMGHMFLAFCAEPGQSIETMIRGLGSMLVESDA